MIYTDQINHNINLSEAPKRIISIVPSQTELLFDLGLDDSVVGITKFCIHPASWFKTKNRVGGTKKLNIDKIKALKPDLIIANKEENEKEQIKELQQLFPVWTSDIATLENSLEMISSIGEITNTGNQSNQLIQEIKNEFKRLKPDKAKGLSVMYLIWRDPYMSIGTDTFIHDMLTRCGFKNSLIKVCRYPIISNDEMKSNKPDLIFLSSEPYPFKGKHIAELLELSPMSNVVLVDGEFFSWYGSRLRYAPKYFIDLINKLE